MTAPTEAEIRAAVLEALDDSRIDVGEWVQDMLQPITYVPQADRGPAWRIGLWDDLPPSQSAFLEALGEGVYQKVQPLEAELTARILEYVVEAGLEFAARFPDASRPAREAVSA